MQERYDILKEDPPGEFLWLEAAASIEAATARVRVLAAQHATGRFIVFDQQMQTTVVVPLRVSAA
jgi:hypothetical protein